MPILKLNDRRYNYVVLYDILLNSTYVFRPLLQSFNEAVRLKENSPCTIHKLCHETHVQTRICFTDRIINLWKLKGRTCEIQGLIVFTLPDLATTSQRDAPYIMT
jgi:hypothetical protein